MKKWTLFFVLIIAVQMSYKIMFMLAAEEESALINIIQENKDSIAIKKVIETYYESFAQRDSNSIMSHISNNFSAILKGKVVDYNGFKSYIESWLKDTVDISIGNLNILKLDISDNKATIFIKYNFNGFNLNTLNDINVIHKRQFALVKENGSWKILSVGN